ncbi:hypothetical protein T492DRAFT_1695 [Pavlovales sp. CCMP2436]|nr:hypothetical protein T492DRAFT_1695 [Pavlovales sp. CCMP2436]|mmetsp:Transcript_49208/g.112809  ORF Transcript_49208/g.112809 Transcript_49208/m.112809 type:complete len:227 (-) Transcript_49208:717-1397(-)
MSDDEGSRNLKPVTRQQRSRQDGFAGFQRETEAIVQEGNSLSQAVHVAGAAIASAAGFAVVGGFGARIAMVAFPLASREIRWGVPSVSAALAAILGAQQGTLRALIDVQPIASFVTLQQDYDEAMVKEAGKREGGGGRGSTYVIREHRAWNPLFGDSQDRLELIAHSNVSNPEAVAAYQAADKLVVDEAAAAAAAMIASQPLATGATRRLPPQSAPENGPESTRSF